ncbi:polyamine ABC transporter substrate-binding protein [Vibrio maerlii]|uniref:polyamine ABC transporter substrate-binding protein n=1 Tax=Vibrio maerlii TaxID=2231648 RepID=UPI000E3B74EF|nr:spermidine/putrescine ABC transporter substrate-binding protein [Vibrio maerlii]
MKLPLSQYALTALIAGSSSLSIASEDPLRLYLWEDSLSQQAQTLWKEKDHPALRLDYFDNDDERNRLMLNSEELPFDIIVLDNVSATFYGSNGSLVKVNDLANYTNSHQRWNQACGEYAIPYFWGVLGIVYREQHFDTTPSSWNTIINPDPDLSGHIGLINDSIETLLPALMTNGHAPYTTSMPALKQAYQTTSSVTDDILTFEYSISFVRSHRDASKLHLAMSYSGDQYSLNEYEEIKDWQFVVPEEGTTIWVDCLAINKYSPHIKQARTFLNFILDEQVAAINALQVMAATTNLAAMQHLPASYTEDKTLFPSQDVLDKSFIDRALDKKNISLRAKIINSIVSIHEAKH